MALSRCFKILTPLIALCTLCGLSAQTPSAPPAGAKNAQARILLARALVLNGLSSPGMKPWHMKATYEIQEKFPPFFKQKGTFEEWWKGPDQWRRTYTAGRYTWTQWRVDRTHEYDTRSSFPLSTVDPMIGLPLVDPLRKLANFKPEYPLQMHATKAGVEVECISVAHGAHYAGGTPPFELFPRYCIAPANAALRGVFAGNVILTYNKFQVFQKRGVATVLGIILNGQRIGTAKIDTLEPLPASQEAMLKPTKKAIRQPYQLRPSDAQPVPVYQDPAVTSASAADANARGTVVVSIVIQKNGKVKLQNVMGYPSLLAEPAGDAVRLWRYKPYRVNGKPVNVATDIFYNFYGYPFASQVPVPSADPGGPYKPTANPEQQLQAAETQAQQSHKRIMLIVGGDWCIWCQNLDLFFEHNSSVDKTLTSDYVPVKISMTARHPHHAFLAHFPAISVYPQIFILDAHGKLLTSENPEMLQQGGSYNPKAMEAFLEKWKAS